MPRAISPVLRDCYERANPYTEYRVELSEPDVGQILRRADQFVAPVSMTPAGSLAAAARGALTLAPSTVALASFAGAQSTYDLNGEDAQRRLKGLSWSLDPAFKRATLKTVQATIQRVTSFASSYAADFEMQIFRITKTPGVKQKNVGTPQYSSTAWTEYAFTPLLSPAPVIKSGSITWDGAGKTTLNFDCTNWGFTLENSLVRPTSPDQVGELPEYLIVVRLSGKAPAGTGHYRWLVDTVTNRTIANVGTFQRTWWARNNDQEQWTRTAYADVPAVTVNVEAYPATGSAVYLIDQGAAPRAVAIGRVAFERSIPAGTSATLEISSAGTGGPWTLVSHGDIPGVAQRTYHLRVTLNADSALRASPAVSAMGVESRIPRDVSVESTPMFPTREIDLPWAKASIAEGKLRIVRTGVRDYLDIASVIGSTDATSRLECDIYLASRHPSVTRKEWHRIERLMVTNRTPMATSEELTLLSYASRLKRKVPQKAETLTSVHTVVTGSTAAQTIVTPALPGASVGGNEYDGKNYYIRVRTSAATNTPDGFVAVIQGNTGIDRLDFSPALPEPLLAGDVIEVHSGVFQTRPVTWTDYDPADVWWEVLTDLLAIPSERVGAGWLPRGGKPPKVTDRAPGDATTQAKLKVTGRLSEQESGDSIIEQLDTILGGVTIEVDGQMIFVQLVPLSDITGAITVPLPSPAAVFDARDFSAISTPPGIEKRATIVSANYGVPATAASPDAFASKTTTVVDNDALVWLAQQDLEDFGTAEMPKEVSRWLYNSADAGLYLATVISSQLVRATSTGLRIFPVTLVEKHPELVPGDVIVIITDQYTDFDPATQTSLRGPMAIRGVIVRCGSEGRQISIFVPGLQDNVQLLKGGAIGANTGLGKTPSAPVLSGSFDSSGQLVINSSGDDVTETQRIAYSITAVPSAAAVRAAPLLSGQVITALTGATYAPGQSVYIAAFAYNGNGVESLLSSAAVIRQGTGSAGQPTANIRNLSTSVKRRASVQYSGVVGTGGLAPLQYQRRIDVEGVSDGAYSAWASLAAPVTETINASPFHDTYVFLQVKDANGVVSVETNVTIPAYIDSSDGAGVGQGHIEEGRQRGGDGGLPTPGTRLAASGLTLRDGSAWMIDPDLARVTSVVSGPTGIGMTVVERGGNKGDNAIDTGYSVVASAIDMARAFLNKHLGNIPDDATSDRRSATANQKTGGDRGIAALDSGNVLVAGSADMSRSYTGKHLGNIPDDATTDRRSATANQKTGGDRGVAALDSGNVLVAGSADFTRSYTGKNLSNVPDDATSDRRAATANQKTGGDRGIAALDSGNVVVAASADFTRGYTGKNLSNIPDDATSDRRAATLNEKTGGTRGFNGLDGSYYLVSGVTAAAKAADGVAGIESATAAQKKAARNAGHASGLGEEGFERGGSGGIAVPSSRIDAVPVYDLTGASVLVDTVAKELTTSIIPATGFQTKSDFSTRNGGGTTSFQLNRQNVEQLAKSADVKTFSPVYDAPPQMRAIPQALTNPNVAARWEIKPINVLAGGYTARAVYITGDSSTAQSEQWATSLNGTPVTSVTLQSNNAVAYCNLASANSTLTTYKANFDVDTSNMDPANTLYVSLYQNLSTGGTAAWTLVGQSVYGSGLSLTGEQIAFDAALALNYDLKMVITYATSPRSTERATVTANSVTYNKVTPGTENSLTPAALDSILFQAMVAP